jgi:hypothetical protein
MTYRKVPICPVCRKPKDLIPGLGCDCKGAWGEYFTGALLFLAMMAGILYLAWSSGKPKIGGDKKHNPRISQAAFPIGLPSVAPYVDLSKLALIFECDSGLYH